VPSAVVAGEWCYLLNPAHARFGELSLGTAEPFGFDPRLSQ
jgi:RES domain-containing protein